MSDPIVPEPTPPVAPAAPAYAPAPVGQRTNVLAIVGFILAFFVTVAGIVLGFIALSQIKRTGEGGHGLALAAVILGFVFSFFWIIWIIVYIFIIAAAVTVGHVPATGY